MATSPPPVTPTPIEPASKPIPNNARRNVMEKRHYENVAAAINMVLLNTPEDDRVLAIDLFTKFGVAIAHINQNMVMSEFLTHAGIPHSITDENTGSNRSRRGGMEGLAAHKRL